MRVKTAKTVLEMTREELKTIKDFIAIMRDEGDIVGDWDDVIDDFPEYLPATQELYEGDRYDVRIVE